MIKRSDMCPLSTHNLLCHSQNIGFSLLSKKRGKENHQSTKPLFWKLYPQFMGDNVTYASLWFIVYFLSIYQSGQILLVSKNGNWNVDVFPVCLKIKRGNKGTAYSTALPVCEEERVVRAWAWT